MRWKSCASFALTATSRKSSCGGQRKMRRRLSDLRQDAPRRSLRVLFGRTVSDTVTESGLEAAEELHRQDIGRAHGNDQEAAAKSRTCVSQIAPERACPLRRVRCGSALRGGLGGIHPQGRPLSLFVCGQHFNFGSCSRGISLVGEFAHTTHQFALNGVGLSIRWNKFAPESLVFFPPLVFGHRLSGIQRKVLPTPPRTKRKALAHETILPRRSRVA
jgi:hypothetical protein